MAESRPDPAIAPGATARAGSAEWRRRRFVVDPSYQLRAGVLVGMVAVVLLVLLNASLLLQFRGAASLAALSAAAGRDRASWALLLAGSAIFLLGVVLVAILDSHRTAGAAFAIRRAIDEIAEGRTDVRVRLRRGDHLQELAASVNRLAQALDGERRLRP